MVSHQSDFSEGMVKNLGIPFVTTGEDDVGKVTEFLLCVRLHLEVGRPLTMSSGIT